MKHKEIATVTTQMRKIQRDTMKQWGYALRCGEITKNEFDSSIFVGKPVYIYIKVSPFIFIGNKYFYHEEMAREIWSAPL